MLLRDGSWAAGWKRLPQKQTRHYRHIDGQASQDSEQHVNRGDDPNQGQHQPNKTPFGDRRTVWVMALGAIVTLLLATVWYVVSHNDRIYEGVTISDVSVAGLTRPQAATALHGWLKERQDDKVILHYADYLRQATWAELGTELDVNSAVEEAYSVGRRGSWPERCVDILGALTGGRLISLQAHIGQTGLRNTLMEIAREVDRDPVDGEISLVAANVIVFPPRAGRYLDVNATVAKLLKTFEQGTSPVVSLVVIENVRPKIDEPQVREAEATVRRLLNGPLRLTFEGMSWSLPPDLIAALVVIDKEAEGDRASLTVTLDREGLQTIVEKMASEIDTPPADAEWVFTGSSVEVTRESVVGLKLDVDEAVEMAMAALRTEVSREVELPVEKTPPGLSSEEVRGWGIRELVAQASTDYYSGEERMHNIELAAQRLDGTLIPQGQTFCLNDALGSVSSETGYQQAYVIVRGETIPGMGGGLCQVASTLFHAVFWGGYRIVERYPHEYHMPRYESTWNGITYKGLDATIDAGVPFTFENNGPSALFLRCWADGTYLHMALYGTEPTWQVSVSDYSIENVQPAIQQIFKRQTSELPAGKEVKVETATEGFNSALTRVVSEDGRPIDTYTVYSSYRATADVYLMGIGTPATTVGHEPSPSVTDPANPTPGDQPEAESSGPQ